MPKSKRSKTVHLTQVDKKGKELTLKLYANVQESVDKYEHCFVFSVDNMRNTYLKDVRKELDDSRLFFGKTKVMAKALGQDASTEYATNTSQLSKYLNGNVGLLFSSRPPASIISHFEAATSTDFARAGTPATRDFIIPAGLVMSLGGEIAEDDDVPMAHSIEPELRKLGMPTTLIKGKITLQNPYVVCKEGSILDSRQTRLLKLFGCATAEFKVKLLAYWSAATNEVVEIDDEESMDE